MGPHRLSVADGKAELLRELGTVEQGADLHGLEAALGDWPIPYRLVVVRVALAELLSAMALFNTAPTLALSIWIAEAVETFPHSPLDGLRGAAADAAARQLLARTGLECLAGTIDATRLIAPAPDGWPEFSEWAADIAALALPSLDRPACLRGRSRDLLRGAALAALQGRLLTCARLVRWLTFCPEDQTDRDRLSEHIAARASDRPDVAFHLIVARRVGSHHDARRS